MVDNVFNIVIPQHGIAIHIVALSIYFSACVPLMKPRDETHMYVSLQCHFQLTGWSSDLGFMVVMHSE